MEVTEANIGKTAVFATMNGKGGQRTGVVVAFKQGKRGSFVTLKVGEVEFTTRPSLVTLT